MAKQYKPGQFVWIGGKKHRVTKMPSTPINIEDEKTFRVCEHCPYEKGDDCCLDSWICILSLPQDCYPKPVNYG